MELDERRFARFLLTTMDPWYLYHKHPGIEAKFTRATDRTWFLWNKHKVLLEGDREYWPLSWQGLVYWVTQGSRLQSIKFTRATDKVWFNFHWFSSMMECNRHSNRYTWRTLLRWMQEDRWHRSRSF